MPARLAPTPSGYLHPGNAANFALNALLAARTDGRLLLRIDDLDRARFRAEYLADVFRLIAELGLPVTAGPRDPADFHAHWRQDLRLPAYQQALDRLRDHPAVFACPCSRRELAAGAHAHGCRETRLSLDRPDVAWRVDTRDRRLTVPDLVAAPFPVDLHAAMPDFAIRKKDGRPSYQLACTVDDVRFGITHAGRGRDLLASTAAQALLSDLLGYEALFRRIRFVHHPLLRGADGEKLSKRAGAAAVPLRVTPELKEGLFRTAAEWLGPE